MSKKDERVKTSVSLSRQTLEKIEVLKKHFVRTTTSNLFTWLIERDYNQLSNEQIQNTKK